MKWFSISRTGKFGITFTYAGYGKVVNIWYSAFFAKPIQINPDNCIPQAITGSLFTIGRDIERPHDIICSSAFGEIG